VRGAALTPIYRISTTLIRAPKSASKPDCKRPREGTWHDIVEIAEVAVLNKLLAKFFFGAGIALSLVSSLLINILIAY